MHNMLVLQTLQEHIQHLVYEHPFSIVPSLLFFFFLYRWISSPSPRPENRPPSPPAWPVVGNLLQLGEHPHRSLLSLSRRHGDIMLVRFGCKPVAVVSSASVAKEVMKTHDQIFSDRPKSSVMDRLLYNSSDVAAAPYGEYWRQMKSVLVLRLLSNRRVRSFRAVREEETSLVVENILGKRFGEGGMNLSSVFHALTNDVVCRVALGRKYRGEERFGADFQELLHEFMELLGALSVGSFVPWLAWVDRLRGLDGRLDRVAGRFDALLEKILDEHSERRERRGGEGEGGDGEGVKDFVDVLLQVQKENKAGFVIERDNIKAQILDAFSAGTHTTATVLEWAMTELLRHPDAMAELQKEVREITAGKEEITEDDLEEMKYLKAVIKETLRLHPPIPLLPIRKSTQEATLNGYHIPAETLVLINVWAIQRDPRSWENPEEFSPERFLINSSIDFRGQDFELTPFGGGRRICPGISFAMANVELVLATLVRKFDWGLPAGTTAETLDMSESTGLTLLRKTPLLAVATPYICASLTNNPVCG